MDGKTQLGEIGILIVDGFLLNFVRFIEWDKKICKF